MFLFCLFLISCLGAAGFLFLKNMDNKFVELQKSNMLLRSQLNKLKKESSDTKNSISSVNLNIEFLPSPNRFCLIPQNTAVKLCPIETSHTIRTLSSGMECKILEKAKISSLNWYYVSLPVEGNVNSRGWIKESSILNFSDEQIKLK